MKYIKTRSIVKSFGGVHAVDQLSIGIEAGKITGIIGPNGSGKTTLVHLLTGVTPIDAGTIQIGAHTTLTRIKAHEISDYGLTRTFQNIRLFEQITVFDNILVVLTERGVFRSIFERHNQFHLDQAEEVLKRVGLWDKRNELAENLSYGQRKLLEIARALAMRAETYLLDEPFAGLFPEMVKIVSGVIKDLRDHGKTVVLIEHNMELIRELSDHIIVMDAGKLLTEGKPEEVLSRKEVIEAYLGE
jgi:ABC-type branched-subunit amino acid transport system ATPase component